MPIGGATKFEKFPTLFVVNFVKGRICAKNSAFLQKRGLTSPMGCAIILLFENRWCGSMAEQLICNQQVDGSTPFTSSSDVRRQPRRRIFRISYGSVPEWPKGTDCKSAGNAFGGPNPPAPTKQKDPTLRRVLLFLRGGFRCGFGSPCTSLGGAKTCRWHVFRAWPCFLFALPCKARHLVPSRPPAPTKQKHLTSVGCFCFCVGL